MAVPRLLRALAAFLVLPGVVAFAVPALVLSRSGVQPRVALGWLPFAAGVGLLLWSVRDFYVAGGGTLAPWDPPRRLVRVGLYRLTRNPMYVAVTLILIGWTLGYRSPALAFYTVVVVFAFHLRVVLGEEPWLASRYGEEWRAYAARVPRWFF